MAIIANVTAIDRRTGLPTDDALSAALTRCLAVLISCSTAVEQLAADADTNNLDNSELAVADLLVSLNFICGADGKQLRIDTDMLAAKLGCSIQMMEPTPTANMH